MSWVRRYRQYLSRIAIWVMLWTALVPTLQLAWQQHQQLPFWTVCSTSTSNQDDRATPPSSDTAPSHVSCPACLTSLWAAWPVDDTPPLWIPPEGIPHHTLVVQPDIKRHAVWHALSRAPPLMA
jgi:hypothetical protein